MWQIILTDNQAKIVEQALELYVRLLKKQISIVLEQYPELTYDDRKYIENFVNQKVNLSPSISGA
jgi:hypothetical protein